MASNSDEGRRIGVEEEMLLVDPGSGRLRAAADVTTDAHRAGVLERELFQQQVETASKPCRSTEELRADLRAARRAAIASAHDAGADVLACPTPLLPDQEGDVTSSERYQHILSKFRGTTHGGLVCGMHVHVEVAGDDEAVRIVDGIQPWLPTLLALSSNSPINYGMDTGYASWRSQLWALWPTVGPTERFGSTTGYRSAVEFLIGSGAASDPTMVYFDARLSEKQPTVEIRVCDVCTEVDDAVTIAALARGIVETVARQGDREPAPNVWRVDRLRAARWLASRDGLSDALVDPRDGQRRNAATVIAAASEFAGEALKEAGDDEVVSYGLDRLLRRGTGAQMQRRVFQDLGAHALVDDIRRRTGQHAT